MHIDKAQEAFYLLPISKYDDYEAVQSAIFKAKMLLPYRQHFWTEIEKQTQLK